MEYQNEDYQGEKTHSSLILRYYYTIGGPGSQGFIANISNIYCPPQGVAVYLG
jgi:hypothetical protein